MMNERMIAPAFIVSLFCGIGLMVLYATTSHGNVQLEGLLYAGAFGGIGVAIVLWGKHLMPHAQVEQERHDFESEPEEQEKFAALIGDNIQDVTRRKFLSRLGIASMGALGLAALFPLKSLGPNPGSSLFHTKWKAGDRLVTHEGKRIKPTDLEVNSLLTVFPEGQRPDDPSATLLIRLPSDQKFTGRSDWVVENNVAYSKVCTHVGCPVSLYRSTTHELLCPCHQSTFNVLMGAKPVFGPAARPLPQLPLAVDNDGYLYATSDYQEPIGPGFWNRKHPPKEA